MQFDSVERSTANVVPFPQPAQVLRKWCTPEVILVITNLLDEDALLFHIVKQTRQGAAKIILIQAAQPHSPLSPSRSHNSRQLRKSLSFRFAQLVLARMARKLRWVGLTCEPILDKAFTSSEIGALVESRAVDRIIITAQGGQSGSDLSWKIYTEHLLRNLQVPVCVIGSQAAKEFGGEHHAGRVSLALSLNSDSNLALAFASRFAQEHHFRLTVMHVFTEEEKAGEMQMRSPKEIASRLPMPTLREAELFCPLDISVCEGDPATEILKRDADANQDFIILRSAGYARSSRSDAGSIAEKIIQEARCPVIILCQPTMAMAHKHEGLATAAPKAPAIAKPLISEPQSGRVEGCA